MVVDNVLIHSPEAIIVVVSINGHDDVFGFEIHRIAKKQNHRNGWALDSSRFRTYLSMALGKPANDISAMVIGSR
jgi:malate dehydrogenase